MSRNFTEKITVEELADKVWSAWKQGRDFEEPDDDVSDKKPIDFVLNYDTRIGYAFLTPQVEKDLKKVEFDCENISANPSDTYGDVEPRKGEAENYVGLHTLSNGLSYLGITAGGDWEVPIFFMLYWDGENLRGYVPKAGNTWNTKNNMAFGNVEEQDEAFFKEKGWGRYEESSSKPKYDFKKIEEDILKRIIFKEK